jgi:hypothetical protein
MAIVSRHVERSETSRCNKKDPTAALQDDAGFGHTCPVTVAKDAIEEKFPESDFLMDTRTLRSAQPMMIRNSFSHDVMPVGLAFDGLVYRAHVTSYSQREN